MMKNTAKTFIFFAIASPIVTIIGRRCGAEAAGATYTPTPYEIFILIATSLVLLGIGLLLNAIAKRKEANGSVKHRIDGNLMDQAKPDEEDKTAKIVSRLFALLGICIVVGVIALTFIRSNKRAFEDGYNKGLSETVDTFTNSEIESLTAEKNNQSAMRSHYMYEADRMAKIIRKYFNCAVVVQCGEGLEGKYYHNLLCESDDLNPIIMLKDFDKLNIVPMSEYEAQGMGLLPCPICRNDKWVEELLDFYYK